MSPRIEPPYGGPFTVALTGTAVSGKSTAGRTFSVLGAAVIEVIVVPQYLRRRAECRRPDADGQSIHHPLGPSAQMPSLRRLHRIFSGAAAEVPYLVLDVPPMLDSALFRDVDRVLWIEVEETVRIARLKARDGIDEDRARRIRRSQPGAAQGLALADDIIGNSGSRETLQARVRELHNVYCRLAAECRRRRRNGK